MNRDGDPRGAAEEEHRQQLWCSMDVQCPRHGGEQHPKLHSALSGFPRAVLSRWGQTEWDGGPGAR